MNRLTPSGTDHKDRYGGLLEIPQVSKVQRAMLDGFKVSGLHRIVGKLDFQSLLDVGCGIGEYQALCPRHYVGTDNSFRRVAFGARSYPRARFAVGDAVRLPFKDAAFDAVLLANTIHHLSDEQFTAGVRELIRVSRKYILVDDCVRWPQQNAVSRFFYSLDRGTMFRTVEEIKALFAAQTALRLVHEDRHVTFPRLYRHAVLVYEK